MDRRFDFERRSTTRIVIGNDVQARLPSLLRELGARDVFVLHDEDRMAAGVQLAETLGARSLPLPAGEALKDLHYVGEAASWLRAQGADRDATLLAFGGGAVTDFTGFLASVWLRGVRYVACPTTTLALCDAALGGKNGVDLDGRKNELGTIRQPALLAGDVAWLTTLPDDRFREGFVEVAKMAAVLDGACFARLEQLAPWLHRRDATAAAEAIEMAVTMKMAVVLADETELDRRRWLNFGHTIGHALESVANGALRHGECVALGMLAECRAADVHAAVHDRLQHLLTQLGASTSWPRSFTDVEALWRFASQDKKVRDGRVPMIVPTAIGTGVAATLTRDLLARAIA